jgi:hypothetical protein
LKEFLDFLYKQCASPNSDGVDAIWDVIPVLCSERKFGVVNQILIDMDLSRVHTSTMYSTIHVVSRYINQLLNYDSYYQRVREEFARRGEPSKRISNLFDKYKDGWQEQLYDPNAPPYKSPEERSKEKLDAKIEWANQIGDKELVDYLTYYKSNLIRLEEKDRKFRELRHLLGEDEIRKRAIKSLREMADVLEKSSGCWPGIYYADLPENPLLKKTFIDGIEVVISYPWPA